MVKKMLQMKLTFLNAYHLFEAHILKEGFQNPRVRVKHHTPFGLG